MLGAVLGWIIATFFIANGLVNLYLSLIHI